MSVQVTRAGSFVDHRAVEIDDPAWAVEIVFRMTGPIQVSREVDDAGGRTDQEV